MEFKKNKQQMLMDQQSKMHKQQLEMMKMVQQHNQTLMAYWKKLHSQNDCLKSPEDFVNLF